MWTTFMWFATEYSGEFLRSIKGGKFADKLSNYEC
jgi:hypothetical protein